METKQSTINFPYLVKMNSGIFLLFFLLWVVVLWSCYFETCHSKSITFTTITAAQNPLPKNNIASPPAFQPPAPATSRVTVRSSPPALPPARPTSPFAVRSSSPRLPPAPATSPVTVRSSPPGLPAAPVPSPVTVRSSPPGLPAAPVPSPVTVQYSPVSQPPSTSPRAYPPASQPLTVSSGHQNPNPNQRLKIIIGVSAGCFCVLVILLYVMVMYIRRRRRLSRKTLSTFKEKMMNMESIMNSGPKRYHYSEIKKMTNSFSDKVGEGGYGIVYRGKLDNGTLVAIKVLKVSKSDGEDFINEVMSISKTSHVNIVSLLGFSYNSKEIALVYEFMSNGSLDSFISRSHNLEMRIVHRIVVGVAKGLEYLHCGCSTRIVHFDIKPQNILLDEDFNPKISDFGLAKLCKRKDSVISMMGARGTAGFIAPEVFSRAFGIVSYKSDVYSYGMLVLDLVLGGTRNPSSKFLSDDSEMYFPNWVFKNFEAGKTLRTNQSLTEEEEEMERKMVMVGLWCIQTSPLDRPSMTKVLEMLDGSIHSLQMPPRSSLVPPQQSTFESLSSDESV